jgi:PPM family protein phosphatase
MIKAEEILDIALQLTNQLLNNTNRISSLEIENTGWTLKFQEDTMCSEPENIQTLIRFLLQAHSRIIPSNLSNNVLMAHLILLAPTLPIDFIPIIGDALSDNKDIQIADTESLQRRLQLAIQLNEDRRNPLSSEDYYWDIGYDTHIGRRKSWFSQTNQDNFFYGVHDQTAFLTVADGISMCTAGSGDVASKIAVHVANHFWEQHKSEYSSMSLIELRNHMVTLLDSMNYHICETTKDMTKKGIENEVPMGTTIVIAIAQGSTVTIASLGDSRVYALLESGIAQLTGDQNVRGEKLRHHLPLESEDSGKALLRFLGRFSPDDFEPNMLPPDIITIKLLPNEALLLCSDGVTDYISNKFDTCNQILLQASKEKTPMETCWKLTKQSNIGGGGDNITSVFARLVPHVDEDDTLYLETNYCKIDGKKYSQALLNAADKMSVQNGNNEINLDNVEELFNILEKYSGYSNIEKDTLIYILNSGKYNCTTIANAFMNGALRFWDNQ